MVYLAFIVRTRPSPVTTLAPVGKCWGGLAQLEGFLEGDSPMDSLRQERKTGLSATCAIPSLLLLLLWLLIVRLSTLRLFCESTELLAQRNPAPTLYKNNSIAWENWHCPERKRIQNSVARRESFHLLESESSYNSQISGRLRFFCLFYINHSWT